jgi:hypothetical protein
MKKSIDPGLYALYLSGVEKYTDAIHSDGSLCTYLATGRPLQPRSGAPRFGFTQRVADEPLSSR